MRRPQTIVQLDEPALGKAFGPGFVAMMRHTLRQLGEVTHATTLPEVAASTDTLTPIVNGLTIIVTATNAVVADLEVTASDHRFQDVAMARRLDDLQSELENARIDNAALRRTIEDAAINAGSIEFNLADIYRRLTQLEDR